jgi:hypothetical protein
MTKRIYWADIIECEEQLFEDLDTLVAVATETPECFITGWSDNELVSVDTNDEMELVITYTTIDDYDDNGDEIRKTETESFGYNYQKELAVLVP